MNVFPTIFHSTLTSFLIFIRRFEFTRRIRNLLPVLLDHRPGLDLVHHQEDVERVAHQVQSGSDEENGPPRGERRLKMSAQVDENI